MPAYPTSDALPHPKTVMTVNEAALRLGVSKWTIRDLIKTGKIGAFIREWRYGVYKRRAYFIPVSELKRYVVKRAAEKVLGQVIEWKAPKNSSEEPKESVE